MSPLAGFSTGLGLHVWGQEFAYAWTPYGDLGDTQYFSLLIHFGAQEARKNLIQYHTMKTRHTVGQEPNSEMNNEPEYQQLMQLLTADEQPTAQAPSVGDGGRALILMIKTAAQSDPMQSEQLSAVHWSL